ncbi:MAG: CBS domain-containing protein, partial [Nitrosopumilales archaeon]|nr:CBS domain-containing protein [Nitrosopumilales archaeon]
MIVWYTLKRSDAAIIIVMTTITDSMRKKLETIEKSASVQEAAKKMTDKNVSSLIVVGPDGKPQGLVTERDLVKKVCLNDLRTSLVTNEQIMSSPLITIDSKSSPSVAADMMLENNVRHLLVVDEGSANKPIGII